MSGPILSLSRAVTIDGRITLLTAPFDAQGRIIAGFALNPTCADWYEPFRRVTRLFAQQDSPTALGLAVAAWADTAEGQRADPGHVAVQIAQMLAIVQHCYAQTAKDAYRSLYQADGDGHAIL